MHTPDEITVLAYKAAVNRGDFRALDDLMDSGYQFVDARGNIIAGKSVCLEMWRSFFREFPDYSVIHTSIRPVCDGVVEMIGRSECTEQALQGPGRWRARVANGRVVEWQVFDASTDSRRGPLPYFGR